MTSRTPQWHYEQADRLIGEAATEHAPIIAQQKTARAHVHALLAQCAPAGHVFDHVPDFNTGTLHPKDPVL